MSSTPQTQPASKVPQFDMIVFGGTGDLAMRKLMPALLRRDMDEHFPDGTRVIGVGRSELDDTSYAKRVKTSCQKELGTSFDEAAWEIFVRRVGYVQGNATDENVYRRLRELLGDDKDVIRVFYLSTAPDLFGPTSRSLGEHELVHEQTRVVIEKPIGRDLASSQQINDEVGAVFAEAQIFRIDHYLGKEAVQNLLALRFANTLFEPVWRSSGIDHIQITVSETLGVESRGSYYDHSGALRDMVQNHILQLLCLVAMEPPSSFEPDAIRDEKRKVLRALKPINESNIGQMTIRGQYRAGTAGGKNVPGYNEELGLDDAHGSMTETFVAIKGEISNWRWGGVPFYLRTGKRLAARGSEIVIQFKDLPHDIFAKSRNKPSPNRLIIRLQPEEAISLTLMTKVPGSSGMRLRPAPLNLSFAEEFNTRSPEAYERLLMDVVRGNSTLFMRRDEIEAAWSWVEPILDAWKASGEPPRPYHAGSWGPSAAIALIERDGRNWSEDAS